MELGSTLKLMLMLTAAVEELTPVVSEMMFVEREGVEERVKGVVPLLLATVIVICGGGMQEPSVLGKKPVLQDKQKVGSEDLTVRQFLGMQA